MKAHMSEAGTSCYTEQRRGVRVVYGAALEKRCAAMHREFESPPLRQNDN